MLSLKETVYNHHRLAYSTSGTGTAVVLLHGFGEDGRVWKNQAMALPNYQVIIPDLPGSGGSDRIADMSMEGLAGSVKAVLDDEKADRCVLIGHSMGGYVTLAFAALFPDRLQGFGLFSSTAYADSEEKKATRRKGIQFMEKHGAFEFLKASVPNLFSATTKEQNPSLVQQHLQALPHFSTEVLMAYYEAMIQRPDRTDILAKSEVPVLFVLGEQDTAVPLSDGLAQSHLPTVSYVKLLQASGHMGMLEEPESGNEALQEF